ncbi:tyrosine-type recombinase/integrase [Neobacillus vireti]|uniref:tyrosine-type recombinase/integrase n=1 Tax=Neobacillus vireti TaxID=220686 RepID=UPI002FFE2CF2
MLLEDVMEEYIYHCHARGFTKKTMKNKRQEYKQLINFLKGKRGITDLESITLHDLRAYVRLKQQQGLKPQSIVAIFKIVKAFFSWCKKEGYIEENIPLNVELPKVPKNVLNGFTVKEVQTMIDAFSFKNYIEARDKALISMLADCGLRAMEIRGLTNENVRDSSILVNGKGNKQRIVFISPALKRILIKYERLKKEYFKDMDTANHYFLTYIGTGLSHVTLDNVIKKAGKRAGIEGKRVSPHTFRHFFAVQCLTTGQLDVYSLSRLLGHADISITQKYLQTMNDEQLLTKAVSSSPLMNFKKALID